MGEDTSGKPRLDHDSFHQQNQRMAYEVKLPNGARFTMCAPGNAHGAEAESSAIRTKGSSFTNLGLLLRSSRAHGYASWQFEMNEKRHNAEQSRTSLVSAETQPNSE